MNAIETHGLGKRYGRTWALRDCTLAIPAGRVAALIGPNGAGKTTLLQLAVGLTGQTAGEIVVLDGSAPGSPEALDGIAFVAQDTPLYKYLSVADTLRLVASLADSWDGAHARARLDALGIPLKRKVGKLSGGQPLVLQLAVGLEHRVRVNGEGSDHLPDLRQSVARDEIAEPQRLLHLLHDLQVGRHARARIEAKLDGRCITRPTYRLIYLHR